MKKRERRRRIRQAEALLEQGYTFEQAARAIGVNPSTLWRWRQKLPPEQQERLYPIPKPPAPPAPRPRVPIRMDCPRCGRRLTYKTAWRREYRESLLQLFKRRPRLRFWACDGCGFASWRPLAYGNCRGCGRELVWTHSRRRKVCPRGCAP